MISKDRNRAIIQLVCALIATAVVTVWAVKRRRHMSQDEVAMFFLAYFCTAAVWMIGSYSLAKAKGYDDHTMGGVLLFLFIAGFCIPLAPFLFPGVVLFGLPDKTRGQRRRRRSHASG